MLRSRLLGALEVELDGTVIDSPASQRPWAVFAYIALAARPVPRGELVNAFWPDVLDQSARASLRSALWALRRRLGHRVVVSGDHVSLGDEGGVWVDVLEFERLAGEDPAAALELCRADLLEGLDDEWVLQARNRHRTRVLELLEQQALAFERAGRLEQAISLTRRQTELDPFDEQAHQRLMVRLVAAGDRATALRTYQALAERLRRELGVAASARTRELAESVRAEPVVGANRARADIPGLLPLIGRAWELGELERMWAAAARGRGAVGVLRGEAGIGKTRLATELRLRASRAGALTAACAALDLGGTAPLSLWAELIRDLLAVLSAPPPDAAWPDDLAVLVAELPAHFGRTGVPAVTVPPDLQRTRLFEAVVSLLGWAVREASVLLVLEDVHDADAASLELAGYVARRVWDLPVMMLLTRRELPHNPSADRVEQALRARGLLAFEAELAPLPPDAVAALARQAARLDDAEVQLVVERAEGNALLAVESARALVGGGGDVAPNLRGSVRAALSRAGPDVRSLVEVMAAAARPLEANELDLLGLRDAASDALQTGLLLSAAGRIGFHHALIREAAYAEIPEPRRRGTHERWARALLASEQAGAAGRPDEVARHLRLAGADLQAVPHLVRAAADARAVAALEPAAAYLAEALAIAPERAGEWLELGELEAWRGRRQEAEAAFQRALGLLDGGDPVARARAWLRRGRAYHGPICVPRAVLESSRNALEQLEVAGESATEERSEALAAQAWAEAVAGSVDTAERLLIELSQAGSGRDDLRTYDAGHARALAYIRRGRFADAYGPSIAAGEAVTRAGRPDLAYGCWANVAGAACAAGEPERALEFIARGLDALRNLGLQSLEIHLLAARSFVLRGLGRLAEARAAAEAEQALAGRLGQPGLEAMARADRGLVALSAGDYATAARLLEAALVDDAPISRPLTRLALAEALARAGQPELATEQLRATVLEPLRPSDFPDALVPRLARAQGWIAASRGDRSEAERRLREAVIGWERLLERTLKTDSITTVLADLGRPVVGLVEPERELAVARADLEVVQKGAVDAVVS